MANNNNGNYVHWTHRWTFIMAATGSAVGLGNIWKFPYITGENGGGAFVLVYLACILALGIPVMMAEVMLGKAGRHDPIHAMLKHTVTAKASKLWSIIGISGVGAGLVILSFYSVIAGWALEYVGKAASASFSGSTPQQVGLQFNDFLQNPGHLITMHSIFILMTGTVVAMGVTNGLGNTVRILMPLLMALLLVLLGYSIAEGDFKAGLKFLFNPDFSKLSGTAVLVALGHAFFTLSLGMGAIMAYGSYMPEKAHIGKTAITVALLDTLIALVAGMAIFPLVFANGLEPDSGPGLLFVSLPIAFGGMTGGVIFGTLFFLLVVVAAWSSSISLIEPGVAWLEEKGFNRKGATAFLCLIAWSGGIACIYSNNWLNDKEGGPHVFESLDFLASNIMLPLGGLLIAIFVGWVMPGTKVRRYMQINTEMIYNIWYVALRFIAPLGIGLVFANSLGWL